MKPSVLVSVAHYRPGWRFGGPTRTIANLVDHLGAEIDFHIVTSDRDYGETQPLEGITADRWQRRGAANVLYLSAANHGLTGMARVLRESPTDVLYLNSFFHPAFTVNPLLAMKLGLADRRPCVLAPRGECAPAALQIKRAKKSAFMSGARLARLYSGLRWQASSPFEAADIARALPGIATDISVAGNLPPSAEGVERSTQHRGEGPLRLVLLSRLSRMKNVRFALEVVTGASTPVDLDLWGTLEDEAYWAECQQVLASAPPHVRITHRGPAPFDQVPGILASYDMLFLPSLGENYGHVIAEALSAGTPVLISDRTPWRHLARDGAGWDLSLDNPRSFRDAIAEAAARCRNEGPEWNNMVRAYAARVLLDPATLEANRRLLTTIGTPANS